MESIEYLNSIIRQDIEELRIKHYDAIEEGRTVFDYIKVRESNKSIDSIRFYYLTDDGGFVYIIDDSQYHHKLIQLSEDDHFYYISDEEYDYCSGDYRVFLTSLTCFIAAIQHTMEELKFKGEL